MSSISLAIEKVLNTHRREGLRILLRDIRRKIWNYQKAVWLVRDLSVVVQRNRTSLPVEIDFSHPEKTMDWLVKENMLGTADPRELKVAREYKHLLPLVEIEGEIVGYLKIGFGKVYVLDFEREFDFPNGVAFIYDTYVAPSLRGQNVGPFLIDRVAELMKEKGYTRIYCHIRVKNLISIRAYQKCGFKPMKTISWFSLFGLDLFSFPPDRMWTGQGPEVL
jgi:ribosomal protein S18 acetylase RimI-like enzyme